MTNYTNETKLDVTWQECRGQLVGTAGGTAGKRRAAVQQVW